MVYLRDFDVGHFDSEGKISIHQCLPKQSAEANGKKMLVIGCASSSTVGR